MSRTPAVLPALVDRTFYKNVGRKLQPLSCSFLAVSRRAPPAATAPNSAAAALAAAASQLLPARSSLAAGPGHRLSVLLQRSRMRGSARARDCAFTPRRAALTHVCDACILRMHVLGQSGAPAGSTVALDGVFQSIWCKMILHLYLKFVAPLAVHYMCGTCTPDAVGQNCR